MTQAPLAICAKSVLGAVTLAAQPHADVELPTGATRPLSLFLLTIAGSGERKSAVDGLALRPVREYEEELRAGHGSDRVSHEADLEIWKARQSRALNEFKKSKEDVSAEADLRALGSAPEPPLLPMMLCPDPTFEGYCKLTAAGLPSIGLFSDEGGSFIGGFGMSAEHRLKTAAALSNLWDGEPVRRVRAGDGAFILPGRRLALHLMAQPEVASQLIGDDMLASQGLLSRLLTVAPESAGGTRFWKPVQPEARQELDAYQARLAAMLWAKPRLREGCRNALDPLPLPLSEAAKAMWIGFLARIIHDAA